MTIRVPGSERKSSGRPVSVGFVSLGCAKNLVDSEVMACSLASGGFAFAGSPERADVIVVNTCAFIHDARVESVDAVLEACELKKTGRARAVVVAGCLPQRYRHALVSELPEVDAFIGLDELHAVSGVIAGILRGERPVVAISKTSKAVINPAPGRPLLTGAPFAYIKVSEGCDHGCAFCAIPKIRGRYRSRSERNIVSEAEGLLSRGVRELNLISQDIMFYGRDLGGGAGPARLLRKLGRIGGRFWIRLLYGHPGGVRRDLLETIGQIPQVCGYLDLPVQHAHSAVLRAMGRSETGDGLRALFRLVREVLPGAVLRTTFLLGFPGETEKRFENLLEFLKEIRFDHVGVFAFSPEENTREQRRPPPRAVVEERMARLLSAQKRIVREKARARIGERDTILVENKQGNGPGLWRGRSRGLAPEVDGVVFLNARSSGVAPGSFVEARYTGYRGYDMSAVEV